jgi:hypothetical protein
MDAPESPLSRFLEAAAYALTARNGDLGVVLGVFKIEYDFSLISSGEFFRTVTNKRRVTRHYKRIPPRIIPEVPWMFLL